MIPARCLFLVSLGLLLPVAGAHATSAVHPTTIRHTVRPVHATAKVKPAHVHVVKSMTKAVHRKPKIMPAV